MRYISQKGEDMLERKQQNTDNKNIYLVGGIIMLFLIFMLLSVVLVINQVNQGSSADMLRKRNASAHLELKSEIRENSSKKNYSMVLSCVSHRGQTLRV